MENEQVRTLEQSERADLLELADALQSLAGRMSEEDVRPAMSELVQIAVDRVPGADHASLTLLRPHHFDSEAASDDIARRADLLQHEAGGGPAVDETAEDGSVVVTGDLADDPRVQPWGNQAHEQLGLSSVLSQRLTLLGDTDAVATLNLYSRRRDAFDDAAVAMGLVLSSHASLLATAMLAKGRATHLMRALASNREIGVAMGILMQRHQVTRDEAFALLRKASQDSNRKLSSVASDVADTGILASPTWPLPDVEEPPGA